MLYESLYSGLFAFVLTVVFLREGRKQWPIIAFFHLYATFLVAQYAMFMYRAVSVSEFEMEDGLLLSTVWRVAAYGYPAAVAGLAIGYAMQPLKRRLLEAWEWHKKTKS